jgi:hypothetical protein
MNETNTQTKTELPRTPEAVAETLTGLGRDWASYGLRLAQMALEQSAGTLGKVAAALDGIRQQVEVQAKADAPPAAESQAP